MPCSSSASSGRCSSASSTPPSTGSAIRWSPTDPPTDPAESEPEAAAEDRRLHRCRSSLPSASCSSSPWSSSSLFRRPLARLDRSVPTWPLERNNNFLLKGECHHSTEVASSLFTKLYPGFESRCSQNLFQKRVYQNRAECCLVSGRHLNTREELLPTSKEPSLNIWAHEGSGVLKCTTGRNHSEQGVK